MTSFYPLAFVARRIVGDHAQVLDLTHPGQEPHDIELTVRQTAELADADVVVYERGFQAAVDDAVDQSSHDHVVDASVDGRRGGRRPALLARPHPPLEGRGRPSRSRWRRPTRRTAPTTSATWRRCTAS